MSKKNKKTSINQHHTMTMGRLPEAIQADNDAAREQAMTPMLNHIPVGNIAPSQDHWGTQQPIGALGSSTL
jgi:hypothetical protein